MDIANDRASHWAAHFMEHKPVACGMSTSCRRIAIMASNAVPSGPTAQRVAENVAKIRKARQLDQKELSARLSDVGRPMLPTVVSKIERKDRRIDVDDLVALALALNVSPALLLLGSSYSEHESVLLTDRVRTTSRTAWRWTEGAEAITIPADRDKDRWVHERDFSTMSQPPARQRFAQSPAGRALTSAAGSVEELHRIAESPVIGDAGSAPDESEFVSQLARAKADVDRLSAEIDRLVSEREELASWAQRDAPSP
ncbi:helix-turn-helix transcriptional regulator [Streptomyces californicus]|uniref:helix-turn-helix domain-containing protein n=1 Tax=Streptomyces californicus TaxID=67351 RepID=UPI00296F58C2|nr:helix-turn-helix transcriptional regulator [Streptomyces californicus]MDW4913721.1 helix-turn-helix transcriptional regulator [Streptomyces californicus]